MNIKKWFSFDWLLNSSERQEIKQKIRQLELENAKLEGEKKAIDEIQNKIDAIKQEKVYKNLYFAGNNITVVLQDGDTLMAECDVKQYEQVKNAKTKEEIVNILYPPKVDEKQEYIIPKNDLAILEVNDDFEVVGTQVFLKPCKLPLPEIVKSTFIEIREKILAKHSSFHPEYSVLDIIELEQQYESLKMFWYKLSTSPLEKCRESVLKFVKDNDVRISKTGNLIAYRRVVKWKQNVLNTELQDFVNEEYYKITKSWKKKASNYAVYNSIDFEGYKLIALNKIASKSFQDTNHDIIGNLADLKAQGCEEQKDVYTSWHNSGKYVFSIGDVYKLEGEEPDDSLGNCSSNGLHSAAVDWDYSEFGDVAIVTLINPSKTIFVPSSDSGKFRCSEMKIACLNPNPHGVHIDESLIEQADNEYNDYTIEQLEEAVKTKSFENLSVQDNVPSVSLPDLKQIISVLQQKVVNI